MGKSREDIVIPVYKVSTDTAFDFNRTRIEKFVIAFNRHHRKEKFRSEQILNARMVYCELTESANKQRWSIEYAHLDKESYLKGWELAEAGSSANLEFEEKYLIPLRNGMGYNEVNWQNNINSESQLQGFADALFLLFIESYKEGAESIENVSFKKYEDPATPTLNLLNCLSGKWKGVSIMTREEFSNLKRYAGEVLKSGKLPKKIIPIKKGFSNISNSFIQHTIYRLWKSDETGKPERMVWVNFLLKVFKENFKNQSKTTISKKFSTYSSGNYDSDKKLITEYLDKSA